MTQDQQHTSQANEELDPQELPDPITNYNVDETFFLMDEDGVPPSPLPQISDMSDEETPPDPETGDGPYSRFFARYYRCQGKKPIAPSPTTTDADLEEISDLTPTEHEALSSQQKLEQDPTASAPLKRGKSSDTQDLSSDENPSPFPFLSRLAPNYNITDEEEYAEMSTGKREDLSKDGYLTSPSDDEDEYDSASVPPESALLQNIPPNLGENYLQHYAPTTPTPTNNVPLAGETEQTPGCLEELDEGFEQCLVS